jgi:type I restriction enzyme S subunit
VNWSDLEPYEFVLPSLAKQSEIVKLLFGADAAQHETAVALSRLAEVKSATVNAVLKDHVAKHGLVSAVDHIERLTVGIVIKPAELYVQGAGGVPALRSLNVLPGRLMLDDLVRISQAGHREHDKSRLRVGDVVVVRTGRPGDAAVIPGDLGELNCIDLIIATPAKTLRSDYLSAVLNSPIGRRQFAAGTTGTAQQHFNVGAFRKMQLPVPSLGDQDELLRALRHLERGHALLASRRSSSAALAGRLLDQ